MERFKCFDSLTLPLAPLTLLTGFNAAGKSTALQSLLLLSQSLQIQRGPAELRLKGPLANLGTPSDVIAWTAGSNEIALGVTARDTELLWRFRVPDDSRALKATRLEFFADGAAVGFDTDFEGIRPRNLPEAYRESLSILEKLIFLSASRHAETDLFPVPDDAESSIGNVGPIGEFAAWWLYQEGDSPVPPTRSLKSVKAPTTLRHQVNAWASDLFPGVEFNPLPVTGTSFMKLQIKSGPTSGWIRPANIGYGISYAFPTLVAGLAAPAGSTLIIDSPEAHLHPRGQARMGAFLAQIAASGVQILMETHSDHVMDGVRIAIRQGILPAADAAFHYFTREDERTLIRTPQIDEDGRLSEWPEGFFDQHRRNMAMLIKPRVD